jgi:pyruvate/2-oxoglutarate dehydrogenase complex dihydrolipoamide dehydrogenase (E3) component
VSKPPMTRVGRVIDKGETKGFIKILADVDTQRILGAAILSTRGTKRSMASST